MLICSLRLIEPSKQRNNLVNNDLIRFKIGLEQCLIDDVWGLRVSDSSHIDPILQCGVIRVPLEDALEEVDEIANWKNVDEWFRAWIKDHYRKGWIKTFIKDVSDYAHRATPEEVSRCYKKSIEKGFIDKDDTEALTTLI